MKRALHQATLPRVLAITVSLASLVATPSFDCTPSVHIISQNCQPTPYSLFGAYGAREAMNSSPTPRSPDSARMRDFAAFPSSFEANHGQAPPDAQFVAVRAGYRLLLRPDRAMIMPRAKRHAKPAPITMLLLGANSGAAMKGVDRQATRANYLLGDDPSRWRNNIPTYSRVSCEDVYNGIDIVYRESNRQLEYDFRLAPGADPEEIRLQFEGVEEYRLASSGDLMLRSGIVEVRHNRPVAYQQVGDSHSEVSAAFQLFADGTVGFELGEYDKTRELVIDPVLVYSSYLGGVGNDFGRNIFIDSVGTVYVVGDSQSGDFTHGSEDNADVFVGKLTANGGFFSYTFFGGSKNDVGSGLSVDADGSIYVSGSTQSDDFPKVNSIKTTLDGQSDAFVVKLPPAADEFSYSSLIGGSGDETGVNLATDSLGNAYIIGKTSSTDLPVASAFQPAYGGGDSDVFVGKIEPSGEALTYLTYLGGSNTELFLDKSGIVVDAMGNAYLTGDTRSGDFPLKDPISAAKPGSDTTFDAYVTKLDPTGSAIVYSTYLGGAEDDFGLGITIDCNQNAYVAGRTRSISFTGSSSSRPSSGTADAFVAKLNSSGSAFTYLTFVGGVSGNESANSVGVDSTFNSYITGSAGADLSTINALQTYFTGGGNEGDAFVARLNQSGTVNFSTYLGGQGDDQGFGVAVDQSGAIHVVGATRSTDFLANGPLREQNAGETDAFISKIDPTSNPSGPVILKLVVNGKELRVFGQNFDDEALVRVNDKPKGTRGGEDPTQILISKKGAKKAKPGKTIQIQVENGDGKRSNIVFFTAPLLP